MLIDQNEENDIKNKKKKIKTELLLEIEIMLRYE